MLTQNLIYLILWLSLGFFVKEIGDEKLLRIENNDKFYRCSVFFNFILVCWLLSGIYFFVK